MYGADRITMSLERKVTQALRPISLRHERNYPTLRQWADIAAFS
jgi:hypothetical protein